MKKKHSGPQIVAKLRQADILIGQGKTVPQVCKELDISQHTYYRWRQKYGGMNSDMVFLMEIRWKDAPGSYLPEGSDWWMRGDDGQRKVGWTGGPEPYYYLNYKNPQFRWNLSS